MTPLTDETLQWFLDNACQQAIRKWRSSTAIGIYVWSLPSLSIIGAGLAFPEIPDHWWQIAAGLTATLPVLALTRIKRSKIQDAGAFLLFNSFDVLSLAHEMVHFLNTLSKEEINQVIGKKNYERLVEAAPHCYQAPSAFITVADCLSSWYKKDGSPRGDLKRLLELRAQK